MSPIRFFIVFSLHIVILNSCNDNIQHELCNTDSIIVRGILGEAIDANVSGRLSTFISSANSPAIALFNEDRHETENFRN